MELGNFNQNTVFNMGQYNQRMPSDVYYGV